MVSDIHFVLAVLESLFSFQFTGFVVTACQEDNFQIFLVVLRPEVLHIPKYIIFLWHNNNIPSKSN